LIGTDPWSIFDRYGYLAADGKHVKRVICSILHRISYENSSSTGSLAMAMNFPNRNGTYLDDVHLISIDHRKPV
jgi:hypothetical protein